MKPFLILLSTFFCFQLFSQSKITMSSHVLKKAQNFENVAIGKGNILEARSIESTVNHLSSIDSSDENVLFHEDFESVPEGWDLGLWDLGVPLSGPFSAISSDSVLATVLDGNYASSTYYTFTTSPYQLPNLALDQSLIVLDYWEWFRTESSYDFCYIAISLDGGGTYETLDVFAGSSGDWFNRVIDLTPYEGQQIQLAFQLDSDGSFNYDGWYIDDFSIKQLDPEPLTSEIVSINTQTFPFVFMNVLVEEYGEISEELDLANFCVFENEIPQLDFLEVIPPGSGQGSRLVDIVFVMDNSGSMEEEQLAVSENVLDFVDGLEALDIDYALGLTRFGASQNFGEPILEDNGVLTSDPEYFKTVVWERNVIDGSYEPAYQSIVESNQGFSFRPGALKVIIPIADEEPQQSFKYSLAEVIDNLESTSTILFALAGAFYFEDFKPITDATGGETYDILSDFGAILESITKVVGGNYLIRYKSSTDELDGVDRSVKVKVTVGENTVLDSTSYIPGSIPRIELAPSTQDYFTQGWTEQSSFNIEVIIADSIAPFPVSALLFSKNANDLTYTSQEMIYDQTIGTWSALTLSNLASAPAIDFYINTTDGVTNVTLPAANPTDLPFQIAILPNEAPLILMDTISEIVLGDQLIIKATVTDNTNFLEKSRLLYRIRGSLSYKELIMENNSTDEYQVTVPSGDLTSLGIEYFILATDDFGVNTFNGTPDNPHLVLIKQEQVVLTPTIEDLPFGGYLALEAESTSGLPVTILFIDSLYSVGDTLWFNTAGTQRLSYIQSGNDQFFEADTVKVDFCVYPPNPSIFSGDQKLEFDIQLNREVDLEAYGTGGVLEWYLDYELLSQSQSIKVESSGSYYIIETINNCSSSSDTIYVDLEILNIEPKSTEFFISPNPSTGVFKINGKSEYSSIEFEIEVFNLAGREVSFNRDQNQIDLTELPEGLYLLKIRSLRGEEIYKIRRVEN